MGRILGKVIALICILIFVTFLINHGHIDFSGVDFVYTKAKDAVNSEEGQEIVAELKDITFDVVDQLTNEVKNLITNSKNNNTKQTATLLSVVDGDTIIVSIDGENLKIRLIGVDTPESVNADESKNNIYGAFASDHTKELLSNIETVYLEFDEKLEDQYGRLLAYVWLSDEKNITTNKIGSCMLNGMILKNGYAMDKVYEPNDKYSTSFTFLRKDAQKASFGLWQYGEFVALWD